MAKGKSFNNHSVLKPIAREILKSMGFIDSQILEEYCIDTGQRYCRHVDIVGIAGKKIAIECGGCRSCCGQDSFERWHSISPYFDELYQLTSLPYKREVTFWHIIPTRRGGTRHEQLEILGDE